ncbi:hypothetical protein Ancab_003256 [Ancistrocladus abbreviatus]
MQSFDRDRGTRRAHDGGGSVPNPTLVSVTDISLRTQPSNLPAPSRPPPVLVDRKADSSRLTSDSEAPTSCISEVTVDESSSHFFDVEVDAGSSATAMKGATEKAQSKLETAKETRMRKKDGPQCSTKPGMQNNVNVRGNLKMIIEDVCPVKDARQRETHEVEHNGRKCSGKGSQGAQKDKPVLPSFEQSANVAGKLSQRKCKKKHSSLVDPVSTEGAGEWKEAMQYYELINNDNSSSATQLPIYEEYLVQGTNVYQPDNKDVKAVAFELQEGGDERIKAARKTCEKGDNKESTDSVKGAYEPEENRRKLKATKTASRQEYHEKMVKVAQAVHDTVICEHVETEKRLKGASESNENEKKLEIENHLEKNDRGLGQAVQRAGSDKNGKCSVSQEEKDRRSREALEREEKKNTVNEVRGVDNERSSKVLEREENKRRVKEAFDREELERNLIVTVKQKEEKKKSESMFELEQNDKGCKEAIQEEGGKRTKEVFAIEGYAVMGAWERARSGRNLEEAVGLQGSDKILEEAAEVEECKKHRDLGEERNSKGPDESHEPVANDKKLEEVQERDEDEKKVRRKLEQEEFDKKSMLPCELEKTGEAHGLVSEQEEQYGVSKNDERIVLEGVDEDPASSSEMGLNFPAEILKSSTEVCSLDERFVKLAGVASKLEKPQKKAYADEQVPGNRGIGKIRTGLGEEELNAVEREDMLLDERTESTGHDNAKNKNQEIEFSESVCMDEKTTKSGGICTREGKKPEEEEEISNSSSLKEFNHEEGGRAATAREALGFLDNEKDKDRSESTEAVNGVPEHIRQIKPQQPLVQERKESIQERSQRPNINQTTERKVKIINEFISQEEDREESLRRERELESDRLRKLEEEREREREREKDRMPVDVAAREARERAERAAMDRATAEARQRAMAEARERLERACAEAREKSEKASTEARLRAERAAVERATAEARERAIDKALADRANSEARERMERSVSDKFYSSSREMGMGRSSSFSNTDKLDGGGGESAQRCKARLERHRRTVERVAKALAEKNMCDLLALREQAEKNRLAETLDADIKRWSSGKEGNLRALLSTLQYILGPDSGWQPIPLTEVITAAAVKKAYRKATLCVHPDKLQQRGASVQQKYICEKVFDLLKDAWNKFNSEER